MSKPRSKSEEKRQAITAAATKLFTELSFSQTSMDKVAKEAGVSKQTVYSHFGSKDELFVDTISQKCAAHKMDDLASHKLDDPEEALLTIAFSFLELVLSKEAVAMHRTCVAESESYPHVSRLFYAAGPKKALSEVTKCMAEFNKRGLLNIPEPRFAAVQFIAMVKGEICMQTDYNIEQRVDDETVKNYVHHSVAMFLRAYAV